MKHANCRMSNEVPEDMKGNRPTEHKHRTSAPCVLMCMHAKESQTQIYAVCTLMLRPDEFVCDWASLISIPLYRQDSK